MFDAKDEIGQMVESVWAIVSELKRGDVLSWSVMEQATGIDRQHCSWGTVKKKIRKRMMAERSIAVRAVTDLGWKLLTHSEQVRVCAKDRQRRAWRQVRRGIQEVSGASPDELTMHDRQLRLMNLERMKSERRQLGSSLHAMGKVLKTETLPMRKAAV